MPNDLLVRKGAALSECGRYRWWLSRIWDDTRPSLVWILLNPSTADTARDDPTIRKCMGFAQRWGHGGIVVVNLFCWRLTDSKELLRVDPALVVGELADQNILWSATATLAGNRRVIAGWGTLGGHLGRDQHVLALLRANGIAVECLGITQGGFPRHPLYTSYGVQPKLYLKPGVVL